MTKDVTKPREKLFPGVYSQMAIRFVYSIIYFQDLMNSEIKRVAGISGNSLL